MDAIVLSILALVVFGAGLFIGIAVHKAQIRAAFDKAEKDSEKVLEAAREEREAIIREAQLEAKEENRHRKQSMEAELKKRRSEVSKLENKIRNREQAIEKKLAILERKEGELEASAERLNQDEKRYKRLIVECEESIEENRRTLQTIASLSKDEAKAQLVESLKSEAQKEARAALEEIAENARIEAESKARSMIGLAVQRLSSEHVNESTISVVSLPSDEMKGRIIGREGRNIRAIEQMTGVDVIIDDTPEAVILSCFNPIRREIAKACLEKLISDGRIHPARIEETVKKVSQDFDQILLETGEQAAYDCGITDLSTELIMSLGKLKYRSVGMQTVLMHSVEVAHICGILAGEMGLDAKRAKRAGLLHDIGMAADQETEGHHAEIGAELLKKCGESDTVVNAARSHHMETLEFADPYTVIVHAANTLSSNRPGARREVLETYVRRLENMEKLIQEYAGIEQAYVIQSGREVRALVTPSGVSDGEVSTLSNEIATRLKDEIATPGQVRVTVIRESKFVDYAK